MEIHLICDSRESKITDFLKLHEDPDAPTFWRTEMITTGDYVIEARTEDGTHYPMVIERKSLADYAASINDGRIKNFDKLINFRAETGATIAILMEGMPPTDVNREYCGIPYYCIESSIFHAMSRNQISIFWTRDPEDTARTLIRLCRSMATLLEKAEELDRFPANTEGQNLLKLSRIQPDDQAICDLWASLAGVTRVNCRRLAENHTISDLLTGTITTPPPTTSGRAFPAHTRRIIVGASDPTNSATTLAKMLVLVDGIAKKSAQKVATDFTAAEFCALDVNDLAKVMLEKKPIGKALAKRLKRYLTTKLQAPESVCQLMNLTTTL
jgi:ERCC4-type nuclease